MASYSADSVPVRISVHGNLLHAHLENGQACLWKTIDKKEKSHGHEKNATASMSPVAIIELNAPDSADATLLSSNLDADDKLLVVYGSAFRPIYERVVHPY